MSDEPRDERVALLKRHAGARWRPLPDTPDTRKQAVMDSIAERSAQDREWMAKGERLR